MQLLAKDTNFCGDLHFHRWILLEQGVLWVSMFQRKTSLSQCCFEKRMCFDAGGASIKCWDRTEVGIFASEQGWYSVWVSSGDTSQYRWRCSCQLFTRQIRSMQPSRRFVQHLRQGYSRWNLDIPKATWLQWKRPKASWNISTHWLLIEVLDKSCLSNNWEGSENPSASGLLPGVLNKLILCMWPYYHTTSLCQCRRFRHQAANGSWCQRSWWPSKFFDSKKSNWTVTKTLLV